MPLYQYRCLECDTTKEAFRPLTDRDDLSPVCGCWAQITPMERVLTAPHLHGSENMPNG